MGFGILKGACGLLAATLLTGCSINIYTQLPPPSGDRAAYDQQVYINIIDEHPNTYDPPPTPRVAVTQEPPPPLRKCDPWISLKSLPAFDITPFIQDISPEGLVRAALSRISTVDRLIEKGRNHVDCNRNTTNPR